MWRVFDAGTRSFLAALEVEDAEEVAALGVAASSRTAPARSRRREPATTSRMPWVMTSSAFEERVVSVEFILEPAAGYERQARSEAVEMDL